MTQGCIGEPLSWLLLERYHLGELPDAERVRAARHLSACAACASCFARIEADEPRVLPPLEVLSVRRRGGRSRSRSLVAAAAAAAAAICVAAMAVLVVGRAGRHEPSSREGDRTETVGVKGDTMAFTLVRDDGERIVDTRAVFHDGDRFKALVTCPPDLEATFDLVVFDASGASFPLQPQVGFACGNDAPLPGAFRLTETSEKTVCVLWNEGGPVNRALVSRDPASLEKAARGAHAMCKHLRAAQGDPG